MMLSKPLLIFLKIKRKASLIPLLEGVRELIKEVKANGQASLKKSQLSTESQGSAHCKASGPLSYGKEEQRWEGREALPTGNRILPAPRSTDQITAHTLISVNMFTWKQWYHGVDTGGSWEQKPPPQCHHPLAWCITNIKQHNSSRTTGIQGFPHDGHLLMSVST